MSISHRPRDGHEMHDGQEHFGIPLDGDSHAHRSLTGPLRQAHGVRPLRQILDDERPVGTGLGRDGTGAVEVGRLHLALDGGPIPEENRTGQPTGRAQTEHRQFPHAPRPGGPDFLEHARGEPGGDGLDPRRKEVQPDLVAPAVDRDFGHPDRAIPQTQGCVGDGCPVRLDHDTPECPGAVGQFHDVPLDCQGLRCATQAAEDVGHQLMGSGVRRVDPDPLPEVLKGLLEPPHFHQESAASQVGVGVRRVYCQCPVVFPQPLPHLGPVRFRGSVNA